MLLRRSILVLFVLITSLQCAPLYDHYTYTETIETKISTISLMEQSVNPFEEHTKEVADLKNQIQKMIIYERGKKKNQITTKMWELLGSDNHLVGSYMILWEDKGTLNKDFVDQAIPQIETAYDLMLDYENNKDKESENALVTFINSL